MRVRIHTLELVDYIAIILGMYLYINKDMILIPIECHPNEYVPY